MLIKSDMLPEQEVEKEVWVEEPGGKRRRKTVQQTEYCYEGDMEGASWPLPAFCPYIDINLSWVTLFFEKPEGACCCCQPVCFCLALAVLASFKVNEKGIVFLGTACLQECTPVWLGVYKGSLLKAFRRTVEEGRFGFVIVDANNLRAEDFKPYWDAGQVRSIGRTCQAGALTDDACHSCLGLCAVGAGACVLVIAVL